MIIETVMVAMGIQAGLQGRMVAVAVVGVPMVEAEATIAATAVKILDMMHLDGIQAARKEVVMGGEASLVLRSITPRAGKHFLVDGVLVAVGVVVVVVVMEVVGPAAEAGNELKLEGSGAY